LVEKRGLPLYYAPTLPLDSTIYKNFNTFAFNRNRYLIVIPAKAGIHAPPLWIPAFAGMTRLGLVNKL
jgi:hypothetical protein